ncbi:hypothetical protein TTHERM_000985228 (macronuclear) [Tetrahymena thermophila SB210]|uniref:Uncharacterized protein n=1 Tax=Tetrahymena thermophila (strain SB210) TaxID=312017 RepID=W7XF57_TETTS|nr:hypothetical protein TTHERM_000985228 [Tetrahymena thermophila SB210]EWS75438.1 hypothetical protein TTHERM_000985228 [Tetrahymena thermophila SB210]|eukprot:XP_012652023.1 hypothetical protein TTHERM_000985228 [Tetrahymena thermophila SB210]
MLCLNNSDNLYESLQVKIIAKFRNFAAFSFNNQSSSIIFEYYKSALELALRSKNKLHQQEQANCGKFYSNYSAIQQGILSFNEKEKIINN